MIAGTILGPSGYNVVTVSTYSVYVFNINIFLSVTRFSLFWKLGYTYNVIVFFNIIIMIIVYMQHYMWRLM